MYNSISGSNDEIFPSPGSIRHALPFPNYKFDFSYDMRCLMQFPGKGDSRSCFVSQERRVCHLGRVILVRGSET